MLFLEVVIVLVCLIFLSGVISWFNDFLNPAFVWGVAFMMLIGGALFFFPAFFVNGFGLQPGVSLSLASITIGGLLFFGKLVLGWLFAGCIVGFLYFVSEVRKVRERYDDLKEEFKDKYVNTHEAELKLNSLIIAKIFKNGMVHSTLTELVHLQSNLKNEAEDSANSHRINRAIETSVKTLNEYVDQYLPPNWSTMKSRVIGAAFAWPVTAVYLICHRLFFQLFRFIADYVTDAMNSVSKWVFGRI